MEPWFFIAAGAALLAAGGFFLWGQVSLKKLKRIVDTPTTPIRLATQGFVEVKGRVRAAGQPLLSPLAGKRCVYYRFVVEEKVSRGKNSYWREVIDDKQDAGCLIEDASQASVRVDLQAAELHLKPDNRARSGVFNDAPAGLEGTLNERYGRSSKGFIFNRAMRYTETVLEEGDELYAIGTVSRAQSGACELVRGDDVFIVSDQPEEQLTRSFSTGRTVGFIGAGIFAVVAVGLALVGAFGSRF